MIDFKKLSEIILNNNSFLITTHVNPDADAIGSEIAFANILQLLRKEFFIINHSYTPYNLLFLDKGNKIQKYNSDKHNEIFDKIDVIVCLDFNRSDRIVSMREKFLSSTKTKIVIDHHTDPESFCDHYFIDQAFSSTGEIIYHLIKRTSIVKMNYELAYPIYAAIMTDTGSFRFERTSSDLHLIAAELLNQGVVPGEVYDKIFDQSDFGKIKLLGNALTSLKLFGYTEKIGYMIITQNDFKNYDALESDTDGFVNFALSIKGVEVGLLFIELKDGFKVSFRSKGDLPVNKLAQEWGGGGHLNAAGVRLNDKLSDEQVYKILYRTEKYLLNGKED